MTGDYKIFHAFPENASPDDLLRLRRHSQALSYYGDLARYIFKSMPDRQTLSLLDVGSHVGLGPALLRLLNHPFAFTGLKFDPVEGIAIDPNVEKAARLEFLDISIKTGDILDFPDHSFDIVTCVHALQFAPDADSFVAKLIKIARRAIFILCPFEEKNLTPGHIRSIDREFFEKFGFDDIEVYDSNQWHNGMCCLAYKSLSARTATAPAADARI